MAEVEIIEPLKKRVMKKFRGESTKIFHFLKTLEKNPKKGKVLTQINGILIKELKYKSLDRKSVV